VTRRNSVDLSGNMYVVEDLKKTIRKSNAGRIGHDNRRPHGRLCSTDGTGREVRFGNRLVGREALLLIAPARCM